MALHSAQTSTTGLHMPAHVGTTAPTVPVALMWWLDTNFAPPLLWQRNAANTDWDPFSRARISYVRAASTANGTLATAYENGDTLDGVTLATGDRILLKNQTSGAENGIYAVAASGAPTRATDADTATHWPWGFFVQVKSGTVNANTLWMHTTTAAITLGTTALTFAQIGASGGGGGSVATDAIWDTKGDLAVATGADTAAKLAVGTDGYQLVADSTQTTGLRWAAGLILVDDHTSGVGGDASYTISSIPAGKALLISISARGDTAATNSNLRMRCNGDTGANYGFQAHWASGTTPTAAESLGATSVDVGIIAAASAAAGLGSALVIEIPDYANTTFHKHFVARSVHRRATTTGQTLLMAHGGGWQSTSAITSLTFLPAAGNFAQGTRITVWRMP